MVGRWVVGWVALACVGCSARHTQLVTRVGQPVLQMVATEGAWAPAPLRPTLLGSSQWIQVGDELAYVYIDWEAGLSARTEALDDDGQRLIRIRRLQYAPAQHRVLSLSERQSQGLPEVPDWVELYGPQLPSGTPYGSWRDAPALAHRFHADYPDDLRVVVIDRLHDGLYYEVVWVGLRACEDLRCLGTLLNQPTRLPYTAGQQVQMDLQGVARDRLPTAWNVGATPDPSLVRVAATAEALAGQLQDSGGWVASGTTREEHLVPIGSWAVVEDDVVYFMLWRGMPVAVSQGERLTVQPTPWLPAGADILDDAQRQSRQLPEALEIAEAGPQPAPGRWGRWRIEPTTAWLFSSSGTPDRTYVQAGMDGEIIQVDVFSCEALSCMATVIQPDHDWLGDVVEFSSVRLPEVDGVYMPIAERR